METSRVLFRDGRASRLERQVEGGSCDRGPAYAARDLGATLSVAHYLWPHSCKLAPSSKTKVKANDPHYDAKCFPCVHPWGTGSLLAEPGSGSPARYVRNRATNLESFFRRTARRLSRPLPFSFPCAKKATVCSQLTRNNLWCFWKLDQLIKKQLFFAHRRSKRSGRAQQQPTSNDPMSSWLGTVVPSSIPESAAWWQVPELF